MLSSDHNRDNGTADLNYSHFYKMELGDYYNDYDENSTYIYLNNNDTISQPISLPKIPPVWDSARVCLIIVSVLIFFLGFFGNLLVIWISGFKMKQTVNTTWYLSLAISDFIFCALLPFNITFMVMEEWVFGLFMCKFTSSVMFLNMFSSIFLLVIISVDRCVSVVFPVWAQNQRTVKKASFMVVLAWILAVGLSVPSMIYRDVHKNSCFNNYPSQDVHKLIAVSRFITGFLIPFVVIIICYSVIILKLRNNRMTKSSKPFKVMSALIAAFFFCWLPYHIFILLELNRHKYDHSVLTAGLKVGTSLAAANSFFNPVLYVFMGNDFKQKFRSSLVSKMRHAMEDEGRTTSRYLSRSSSVDNRAPTHIYAVFTPHLTASAV